MYMPEIGGNMKKNTHSLIALAVFLIAAFPLSAAGLFGPTAPGSVEGSGTLFEVTDSDYLNVKLSSAAPIGLYMISHGGAIEILTESEDTPTTVNLILSGLEPLKTYYRYLDGYDNLEMVTSDSSGSYALTMDLSTPHRLVFKEEPSTLFLSDVEWTDSDGIVHNAGWSNSDGLDVTYIEGVQPGVATWDPTIRTASLVDNLSETVVILSDDLTLDGNGFAIDGGGVYPTFEGIEMRYRWNVTIRNLRITGTSYAMYIYGGGRHKILDNHLHNNFYGVYFQWGASSSVVENNVIENQWGAISFNYVANAHVMRNNFVTGCDVATHILIYSGSNTFERNTYAENQTAFQIYGDSSTFNENVIQDNMTGVLFMETNHDASNNSFYNNNFINNITHVLAAGTNNTFNLPLPEGGNFWNDWTSPDNDGDGIVDIPYAIADRNGTTGAQDDLPWATRDGWIVNLAPVFSPIGPQEIAEYDTLTFTVEANDPDGDNIVSLYAEGIPAGAYFDPVTGLFSWRPDGTQAGVYIVSFFALDDGDPAETGQIDVVITVGAVQSPTDLTDTIINDVLSDPEMPQEVENSYTANLKKVNVFIADGKINVAVNQLEAFIQKCEQDIDHGVISQEEGDLFIMMAQDVIELLTGN